MAEAVIKLKVDATEFDAFVKRATEQLEALGQASRAVGVKLDVLQSPALVPARYFVGGDDSGHRYLVPLDRRDDWLAWRGLGEDSSESWNVPDYAVRFEGELLTFTDPRLEGVPLEEFARKRWGK